MGPSTTRWATIGGFFLVVLVATLGSIEIALGETSPTDVTVFVTLAAIALSALGVLNWSVSSLRLSLRAREQLASRLSQQHAVAQLSQLALTDVPLQRLLDEAATLVADELRTDSASVLELDAQRDALVSRAHAGRDPGVVGSELTSPIGSNGGAYGVLCAQSVHRRAFSESDAMFVEAIANVLASASRRRKAEADADEAHLVLEAVIEGTSDDIFVKDLEGRFVTVNANAAETLGYAPEALIGRKLTDVLSPEYATSMTLTDELVLERGVVETFEESIPGRDGPRVVLATKGPYRARNGTVIGTFGIARDITDRKAQEQKIARSEERFRLAQEGARMGTWEIDVASGVTTWSTGLRALYGVEPDYPAGLEHLAPLVHPDDRDRVLATVGAAYSAGRDFEFEFRIAQPDGASRWLLARSSPYHADDGSLARVLGVAVDITERKRAEDDLVRSQEILQHAQDVAGLGAWDWDVETGALRSTPAAYAMLGVDPSVTLTFDMFLQLIHPDDVAVFEAALERGFTSGEAHYESLFRIVRPSGEIRWLINRGTILRRDDGKPIQVVGITVDDTDRRQGEARLRQAEKLEAIGRLAGGVAHDFNNLLVAINGYGELALRRLERGDRDVAANIGAVLLAADRAAGLTRQLLAFGRRQVLSPEILDLNEVVSNTVGLLERVIGDNVELVTRLADEPVVVKADRGQLEQVITNLAVNGRDAMPSGGVLTIGVGTASDANGQVARLTVTDEGSGIDAVTALNIFEPFFTTKGEDGTGLGLATVHGIVAQSGGHVLLDTELGRGTTFEVRLPLCAEPVVEEPTCPNGEPATGNETILVVEDDPAVRSIVSVMLEELGYQTVAADNGEDALERFETHGEEISLVLSDVMMRGLDGRETIDRIRQVIPATRVLYMSGYTDDATLASAELGSGTGFIQKPFSGNELGTRVRELLDAPAQV